MICFLWAILAELLTRAYEMASRTLILGAAREALHPSPTSASLPAALLVLAPAAAGTGVIPSDIRSLLHYRWNTKPASGRAAFPVAGAKSPDHQTQRPSASQPT